jgi:hypothetical protein
MSEELKVFWDARDPMKPIEGESSAANRALIDYARMGYSRSLRKLHEKYLQEEDPPTDSYNTIIDWSRHLDWQDRVTRWEELERQHDEKVWRDRRDQLRSKEWDNFDKLQEIISKTLEIMPSFVERKEKVIEEGSAEVVDSQGRVIHKGKPEKRVITLRFKANDAIRFIRTASDIGRRAAEMDKQYMDKMLDELDLGKLSPEQIARLADGEHLLDILGLRK